MAYTFPSEQLKAEDQPGIQPQSPGGQQGADRPSQFAIDACASSSPGDVRTFQTPNVDQVSGTCETRQAQLVCAPQNRPGGQAP